jgi:hypothetical protein
MTDKQKGKEDAARGKPMDLNASAEYRFAYNQEINKRLRAYNK